MKTVWKYQLANFNPLQARISVESKIVHFAMQNQVPTVWVEIVSDGALPLRTFEIFGTGHEIPDYAKHVGTVQDGQFVWHLYEVTKP